MRLLILLFCVGITISFAQKVYFRKGPIWKPCNFKGTVPYADQIKQYRIFLLDSVRFDKLLNKAVKEKALTIPLPDPDGTIREFRLTEGGAMSEELQKKYPYLHSFQGKCAEKPQWTLSLNKDHLSYRAMIIGDTMEIFIEPFLHKGKKYYLSGRR